MSNDSAASLRAGLYLRQSVDKREGIERQRERCHALVTARGWSEAREFVDNDVSANKPRGAGTAWAQVLEALRDGSVDVVVAVDMDRLLRGISDLGALIDLGGKVVTVDGEIDLTTADGEFRATMLAGIARFEVRRKTERTLRANAARAAKGEPYARRRPFGWNMDGTLHPVEGPALREVVQAVLRGETISGQARSLTAAGLLTPKFAKVGGNEWTVQSLRNVLKSERLAGLRTYRGQTVASTWEPLVPEEDWRKLLAILNDPARGAGRPGTGRTATQLLSGLALCPTCGGGVRKNNESYRCLNSHFYTRIDRADRQVVSRTLGLLVSPGATEVLVTGENPNAAEHRAEAATLRATLADWEDAATTIGPAEYVRITSKIKDDIATVEGKMLDADRANIFAGLTGLFSEGSATWKAWRSQPLDRQRSVVRHLWDRVTLTSSGADLTPSAEAQRLLDAAGGSAPLLVEDVDGPIIWREGDPATGSNIKITMIEN